MYLKYANTAYSDLTEASIESDLNAITQVDFKTLALIKFLTELYQIVKYTAATYNWTTVGTKVNQVNTYTAATADYWSFFMGERTANSLIHDGIYDLVSVPVTLSGGSISDSELLPALASAKNSVLWAVVSCDTVPGTAYKCAFHEDDGSAERWIHTGPVGEGMGEKKWLYHDTSTDNKKYEVDITGGSGTEVVQIVLCYVRGGI